MVSYTNNTHLSKQQVRELLQQLSGPYWLMGALLYSGGLHPAECVKLRVQDLDLSHSHLQIRRHLPVMLAPQLIPHLKLHLLRTRTQHLKALAQGDGWVPTSTAPYISRNWLLQFVFSAPGTRVNHNQLRVKQPFPETRLLNSVHTAAQSLQSQPSISAYDLRRALAHHLLESGCSVQLMQQQLRLVRQQNEIDHGGDNSHRDQAAMQLLFREIFSPRVLGQKHHPDFVSEPAAVYRIAS